MSKHKAAILTGGSGFLGKHFINGLSKNHQTIYILDTKELNKEIKNNFSTIDIQFFNVNVSEEKEVVNFFNSIVENEIPLTTLLNAAASNPSINLDGMMDSSKFEDFKVLNFNSSLINSLTGSALMCREFVKLASIQNNGYEKLILNIGSDLSVIAPDNRIYEKEGSSEEMFKPIEYSISKHGILGLTKYLAVYLADKNFRVNTLSPTGVFNNQDKEFIKNFSNTVPHGRMLNPEELVSHVSYLTSEDSKFLTGQNILVDGGRSIW
ncbi:SDR family oxidoreductase [Acidimicrobiaceae bacterium]|nr:SDR family oxidoreductase [Acidimicrobiaceae bacterium]